MGNVLSRTPRPSKISATTASRSFSTSPLVSVRIRHFGLQHTLQEEIREDVREARRAKKLRWRHAQMAKDRFARGQRSAGARQGINALCLKILGIPATGVITNFSSNGWTFWDFKQYDGQITRVVVIAVDGGYAYAVPTKHPARASIGVWFGSGTAEFGSPYNICKQVGSRARIAGDAEVIAAIQGLLRVRNIHSSGAWKRGLDAIIKTDLMGMADEMNTYIRTGVDFRSRYGGIRPELWENLKKATTLVQSLGINVAFWYVLRENNKYADALATHARSGIDRPFRLSTFLDTRPGSSRDPSGLISVVEHRRSPLSLFFTWLYHRATSLRRESISRITSIRSWLEPILSAWKPILIKQDKKGTKGTLVGAYSQCNGSHSGSDGPEIRCLKMERPCSPWNHATRCKENPCHYPHKCSICHGNHRKKKCPVYGPTVEACGRWNDKIISCDGSPCSKRHVFAYCAGSHAITSSPSRPRTAYWHCVNEKCPTRLPASRSHCVSCGTTRPGGAFSSHTEGLKKEETSADIRP